MQTYLISSGLYCNHGYTWCTFHISKGFFRFLFCSFCSSHILEWRRPQHGSAKRMQGLRALFKMTFFFVLLCFLLFFCALLAFKHALLWNPFHLCLMYWNIVIVFVTYIVSRIKWNVGLGIFDGCIWQHCYSCIVESWMYDGVFKGM